MTINEEMTITEEMIHLDKIPHQFVLKGLEQRAWDKGGVGFRLLDSIEGVTAW